MNPLVSICIPTYNGEKYLKECLESIISQTYKNIEILIVDDCSTDKTFDLIEEYRRKDERIKFHKNEFNLGLVGNWNKCIDIANGEWIKFVFQDDFISMDCVEKFIASISEDSVIIASKRKFNISEVSDNSIKNYYEKKVVTFERLGIENKVTIIHPKEIAKMAAENICLNFIGEPTSIMFKKSVVNEFNNFNVDLAQICDLEFFLRIASNYGITYIPYELNSFRIHSSSTTSTNLDSKLFTLSHLDPIILVNELLFANYYNTFRSNLSFVNKLKLKLFFSVRVYEAYRTAISKGLQSVEMIKINSVGSIYKEIDLKKNPSMFVSILFFFTKWRRKLRTLLN